MTTDSRLNPETAEIPAEYIKILETSKTADFSRIHMFNPVYEAGLPIFYSSVNFIFNYY